MSRGAWEIALARLNTSDGWIGALLRGCGLKESAGHVAAALALYGEPFGFTREDLTALRDAAEELGAMSDSYDARLAAPLRSIAARIAALLPPE
jgi:hypothetical protein